MKTFTFKMSVDGQNQNFTINNVEDLSPIDDDKVIAFFKSVYSINESSEVKIIERVEEI